MPPFTLLASYPVFYRVFDIDAPARQARSQRREGDGQHGDLTAVGLGVAPSDQAVD